MYFASRTQAGRMLAVQLAEKYTAKKCAVMALTDGAVIVGAQIAIKLHCVLTLLHSADIMLPREPQAIAGITPEGTFTYNHTYTAGELEELSSEYFGYIESQKLTQMHELNQLVGGTGTIKKELLQSHNVIIVSDGLKTGFELELATQFLKPIKTENLVVATPLASVQAVDRMHILADDLYVLNVVSDYMDTDHYYEKNDVPDHQTILKTIEKLTAHWQEPTQT